MMKTSSTAAAKRPAANRPDDLRLTSFDYDTAAELFPTRSRKAMRQPVGYKRFTRAADAIRFAIEDLPPALLLGAYLEVDEERFDSEGIRQLYASVRYPLARRAVQT
ncbi:MAG: hypothetical protein ACJ8FU_22835 [Xanthobacteraceae bacterium]